MNTHLGQRIRVWPQYLLPKHALTHLAWWLSNIRWRPFKNTFIKLFCRWFDVNLEEALASDPESYTHFNAFFTRALKPKARPMAQAQWVAPADGRISQLGELQGPHATQLIQAKGLDYQLEDLVGRSQGLEAFLGGQWMTIYLAPYDYHRVHMPASGRLIRASRLPGELFSVSEQTAAMIPGLYVRNERLVAEFEGDHGPFLVVMVAALMVAGIGTVWDNPNIRRPIHQPGVYTPKDMVLNQGEEMGRFHWGSTVIVITPKGAPNWLPGLCPGQTIRFGQALTA